MNTLTKFALVITSIVLPLSANAALKSNVLDSTTLEKMDVVKLMDAEMKLTAHELVQSITIETNVVQAPLSISREFKLDNADYNRSATQIVLNK